MPTSTSLSNFKKHEEKKGGNDHNIGWLSIIIVIAVVLFVLIVLGVVGFFLSIENQNNAALFRYCLGMKDSEIIEGKDKLGKAFAYLTFDLYKAKLSYEIHLISGSVSTSIPNALLIKKVKNDVNEGTKKYTTPFSRLLHSHIIFPISGNTLPLGNSLQKGLIIESVDIPISIIRDLIQHPLNYYLLLITEEYPDGAVSAFFSIECRSV